MNLIESFAKLAEDPTAEARARDAMVDALVAGCEPAAVIEILNAIRRGHEREGLLGLDCQTYPARRLSDDAHHAAHWISGWATNLQSEEPASRAREVAVRFLARFPRRTSCIRLLSYVREKNATPGSREGERRVHFFDSCLREVDYITEFMERVRNLALERCHWDQFREVIWTFKRRGYSAVQTVVILYALHRDMQDAGLDDYSPEMERMGAFVDGVFEHCLAEYRVWATPEDPLPSVVDTAELFFYENAEAFGFLHPDVNPSHLERKCWLWPPLKTGTEQAEAGGPP